MSGADYLRGLRQMGASPSEYADSETPAGPTPGDPSNTGERRRNPRYKCEGGAELRTENSSVRTWATFSEISRGGCYVEMMTTYPASTKLDLKLQVRGFEVHTGAIVRVSYPFLGMGIEFTDMSAEDSRKLEDLIQALAATWREAAPAENPEASSAGDAETRTTVAADERPLLESLQRFFEGHAALTREQFAKLVHEYRGP